VRNGLRYPLGATGSLVFNDSTAGTLTLASNIAFNQSIAGTGEIINNGTKKVVIQSGLLRRGPIGSLAATRRLSRSFTKKNTLGC